MDINEISTWPPVAIGGALALAGWALRKFVKNAFWRILGLLLMVAGFVIIVSEVFGFPLLWTLLSGLLGFLEGLFQLLATLSGEGQDAVDRLLRGGAGN